MTTCELTHDWETCVSVIQTHYKVKGGVYANGDSPVTF